jgi:hypothetical protein
MQFVLKFMLRQVGENVPSSRAALRLAGVFVYVIATGLTLAVASTVFRGLVAEGRSVAVAVGAVLGFWLYMLFVLAILTTMSIFLYRLLRRIVLGIPGFVRGFIAFFCAIPGAVVGFFRGVANFFANASALIADIARAIAAMTAKDWLKLLFVLLGLSVFAGVLLIMWPVASDLNAWIDAKIGFKPDFMHALFIDVFMSYFVCGLSFIVIRGLYELLRVAFSSNSRS